APSAISSLSLHDALPISITVTMTATTAAATPATATATAAAATAATATAATATPNMATPATATAATATENLGLDRASLPCRRSKRSEEHTSEIQSRFDLAC